MITTAPELLCVCPTDSAAFSWKEQRGTQTCLSSRNITIISTVNIPPPSHVVVSVPSHHYVISFKHTLHPSLPAGSLSLSLCRSYSVSAVHYQDHNLSHTETHRQTGGQTQRCRWSCFCVLVFYVWTVHHVGATAVSSENCQGLQT